jgi:predicted amino acid racemase
MERFVSQMKHGYGDTTTMLQQLEIPIKCANWESEISRMKNYDNYTLTDSNYKDIQDFIDDYIKHIDMHRNELDYEKVLTILNQYGVGGFKSSIDLLVDWSTPKYQYA